MKIKGFDDVYYIGEFELKKERAKHSVCHFTASVREETADKYLAMAGRTITVTLDNNMPIFSGIIQEISIERTYAATFLDVSLISLSSLIDQEDKIRIFRIRIKICGYLVGYAACIEKMRAATGWQIENDEI